MKKQSLFILSALIFTFSLLASCNKSCEKGSGKTAAEDRKVAAFTKIQVSGNYKLILKQGAASVKIMADDNLLKLIKTDVSGDELSVITDGNICNSGPMIVNITNPDFQSVKSSGVIDLSSDGKLTVKDFALELAGVSKVNLDINAGNVKTLSSGTAEIYLKGQATENTVTMNGTSALNAFDFIVANYRIETRGDTHCKINVLNELNVNIKEAGEVQYKGNPTKISNQHSGIATISKVQ